MTDQLCVLMLSLLTGSARRARFRPYDLVLPIRGPRELVPVGAYDGWSCSFASHVSKRP